MSAITTNNGSYKRYSGPNAWTIVLQDNGDGTFSEVPAANQDLTAKTLTAQGPATVNSSDLINLAGKGCKVVIDITAVGGSPTFTVTIQGKDPTSGKYYDILVSAGLTGMGTTVLTVYPGLTAVNNVTANDVLPRTFRIKMVEAGGGSTVTATIGVCVIE